MPSCMVGFLKNVTRLCPQQDVTLLSEIFGEQRKKRQVVFLQSCSCSPSIAKRAFIKHKQKKAAIKIPPSLYDHVFFKHMPLFWKQKRLQQSLVNTQSTSVNTSCLVTSGGGT